MADERHVIHTLTDVRSGAVILEVAVDVTNGRVELVMFKPPNLPTVARFMPEHAENIGNWMLEGARTLRKAIDHRHQKLIKGIKP